MNQILKDSVYGYGTMKQVNFIADLGGMNDEERQLLVFLHQKKTDLFIEEEMGIDRKTRQRIEESVSSKVLLAVFDCIIHRMDGENPGA